MVDSCEGRLHIDVEGWGQRRHFNRHIVHFGTHFVHSICRRCDDDVVSARVAEYSDEHVDGFVAAYTEEDLLLLHIAYRCYELLHIVMQRVRISSDVVIIVHVTVTSLVIFIIGVMQVVVSSSKLPIQLQVSVS